MSSKPDTWSRYATIFSLYYFHFEKVDEGKYAIKSADIGKYLVPDEDKVTLSDNKHTWIVEAVGAPDTYYTIRDSEGLGNYFTAGPDQLDPESVPNKAMWPDSEARGVCSPALHHQDPYSAEGGIVFFTDD
ncbi:hypothetical protein F5148DRAFT_1289863 [Russula earlei]|uniref:Uncharacterized protein n=1 Tax=Russula earlei TaxID=71964 RepID=A0ACC0TXT4_9AGAM|nr:hypothetical protein F5148DRAFT_1289863 [Russula earlei]